VRISNGALVEAAVASDRYIADRFLPHHNHIFQVWIEVSHP